MHLNSRHRSDACLACVQILTHTRRQHKHEHSLPREHSPLPLVLSPLLPHTADARTLIGAIVNPTNGETHEIHHRVFTANSACAVIVPVVHGGKPPQKQRKEETFLLNVAAWCIFQ